LLITFATKLYLPSETYISYKFYALYHQKGDILSVRRKRHARIRSIFFSDEVMVLEDSSHMRYWWSYLVKQFLYLKLH